MHGCPDLFCECTYTYDRRLDELPRSRSESILALHAQGAVAEASCALAVRVIVGLGLCLSAWAARKVYFARLADQKPLIEPQQISAGRPESQSAGERERGAQAMNDTI